MAFTSAATNLIPTDSKSAVDVFMRDTCIGAEAACTRSTERISLASDGLQANGASSEPLVGLPMDRGCAPSTQRISLTSTGQQIVGKPSTQPGHMRWDGEVVLFVTAADSVVPDDTSGVEDVFMRGACHDTTTCVTTTTRLSVAEQGLQGNGASFAPRGNHDAWTGPDWATFFSTATNFWPGIAPDPFDGAIFRTATR